jgi:hypothetical protein
MESSFEKFAKSRVDDLLEILAERNRHEINEFMSNVKEAYYEKEKECGWDRLKQAIRGHEINGKSVLAKDWYTASLKDVPVDWMPSLNQKYWIINRDGNATIECISLNPAGCVLHKESHGRLFPTERLAEMYLDSLSKERWKPEVGETYWSPGLVEPVDWTWMKDSVDLARYDRGMVLRTKEEAVDAMEQVKQLLTGKP